MEKLKKKFQLNELYGVKNKIKKLHEERKIEEEIATIENLNKRRNKATEMWQGMVTIVRNHIYKVDQTVDKEEEDAKEQDRRIVVC